MLVSFYNGSLLKEMTRSLYVFLASSIRDMCLDHLNLLKFTIWTFFYCSQSWARNDMFEPHGLPI